MIVVCLCLFTVYGIPFGLPRTDEDLEKIIDESMSLGVWPSLEFRDPRNIEHLPERVPEPEPEPEESAEAKVSTPREVKVTMSNLMSKEDDEVVKRKDSTPINNLDNMDIPLESLVCRFAPTHGLEGGRRRGGPVVAPLARE